MAIYNGCTINGPSYQSINQYALSLPHESPEPALQGPSRPTNHGLSPKNPASQRPLRQMPRDSTWSTAKCTAQLLTLWSQEKNFWGPRLWKSWVWNAERKTQACRETPGWVFLAGGQARAKAMRWEHTILRACAISLQPRQWRHSALRHPPSQDAPDCLLSMIRTLQKQKNKISAWTRFCSALECKWLFFKITDFYFAQKHLTGNGISLFKKHLLCSH